MGPVCGMDKNLSSKRYEPKTIDLENKNSSWAYIVNHTGCNKTVLEIGTSTGYISKILKERENRITGIEIDPEAGLIAQHYCDRMIIGDIEILALNESLTQASFDVIICGDVLEHLKNPAIVLKNLSSLLKPEGYLVISLPNFFHGDVMLNLLIGDFHYTPMGILDETHLRFFGLKNIYSLFADCGYQISDLHTINFDIGNTELKINQEKVPQDLLKFIRSLPNSNVYQYVFIATPSSNVQIPHFDEINLNQLFYNSIESISMEQALLFQQLHDITNHVKGLNQVIAGKDQQLQDFTNQVTNINQTVAEKDQELSLIKNSLIWRAVVKCQVKIVNRLLKQGTLRRKMYDLGLESMHIIIDEGIKSFFGKLRRYLWQK